MIPAILKNMSLALEGVGYLGKVDELIPPKLTLLTEEYRGGGMDATLEIDMGMEALTAEFSMAGLEQDIVTRFGSFTDRLVFRGAYQDSEGTVRALKLQMSGRIKELDMGTWKAGEKAVHKFMVSLTYLGIFVDGNTIAEIDVENMKRIINGTDQLEALRNAIQV